MSVTKLNYDEQTAWHKSLTECYNLYRFFSETTPLLHTGGKNQ